MQQNDLCERRAVVSGVGHSRIGSQVDRSAFQLTLDAIFAAVADAGLTVEDLDGIAAFAAGGGNVPGYASPDPSEIHDVLHIRIGMNRPDDFDIFAVGQFPDRVTDAHKPFAETLAPVSSDHYQLSTAVAPKCWKPVEPACLECVANR